MRYILALDQGTTSSRALLIDAEGSPAGMAQEEYAQHFPNPGWVEHDPRDIWASQKRVARAVLQENDVSASDLEAIGITNQRETTLLWDRKTGEPVFNAIVWQDRRTAAHCDRLREEGYEEAIRERTGLVIDPYFSGTKLHWMLNHVPDGRKRAAAGELAFGTVDSWLIWNLTRGAKHVTDATNASRTMLFNIHTGAWDDELLKILDVPPEVLPTVVPSEGVVAETTADILGGAVPIAGIAGDQQAALFGQTATRRGIVKNTYGTGCFLLMYTGSEPVLSRHRLLTTVALETAAGTEYALEGSIFSGGSVVQWLRDGLGIIDASSDVEALATSVEDNGGVYFVPAFTGLGAPHWDAYARGAVQGLTRGSTAAHIARAALESIAFQSADVIRAMEADSGIAVAELRVDGGAAANDFLMQFQADLLGVPVLRPEVPETTALGAAYLAGLAVGFWPDRDALVAHWRVERRFEPSMSRSAVERLMETWHRALERVSGWAATAT